MPNRYQREKANKEFILHNQYKKLGNDELISLLDDHDSLKRMSAARILQSRGGKIL